MPLRLLVGPPGSGKTARILAGFKQFAPAEYHSSVRLVLPSVSEVIRVRRLILSDADTPGILGDPICAFSRLCAEVVALAGGECPAPISDARRALILRGAIREIGGCFEKAAGYPSFPGELAREIALLKSLRIAPDDLRNAAAQTNGQLADRSIRKLLDLAAIYESYQQALSESGNLDAANLAERAMHSVQETPDPLSVLKYVFVDGFPALDPLQRELLRSLASAGVEVVIALDYKEDGGNAFAGVEPTISALAEMPDTVVESFHPADDDGALDALGHLKRWLFVREAPGIEPDDSVMFLVGATPRMEVELIGEEVCRLARSGTAFSEIAVVAGSIAGYRELLTRAFRECGIPLAPHYQPLSESVLAQAVVGRLGAIHGSRRDRVRALQSILNEVPQPEDERRLSEHFSAWRSLLRVHDGIAEIEAATPSGLSSEELAWLLERGIGAGSYLVPGHEDGVSLLGVGSLHGREFRTVFVLGLLGGAFPRRPREDPFVTEHERIALNAHLPNPLPLHDDDRVEDRRRFRAVVSSARERLYLGCSKHDSFGRAGRESLFLDEVRRLLNGDPACMTRRAREILSPIDRLETPDALVARTVLDCCSAAEDDRQQIAAASYTLLLRAGMLGAGDFEMLSQDDEIAGDRLPPEIAQVLAEVDPDA